MIVFPFVSPGVPGSHDGGKGGSHGVAGWLMGDRVLLLMYTLVFTD